MDFGCSKFADCECMETKGKCECQDCSCGSIPISKMNDFVMHCCQFSDCKCGDACACQVCHCGQHLRSKREWIDLYKKTGGKVGGPCKCMKDSTCSCEPGDCRC